MSSFFKIDDGMLVASPELVFIQMTQRLSFAHLVHFGMMLCGIYARESVTHPLINENGFSSNFGLDISELRPGSRSSHSFGTVSSEYLELQPVDSPFKVSESKRRLHRRAPLTTPEELKAYASQAKGLKGATAAARAVCHVIGRSRSPMESALAIALCLPYKFGGYMLPHPELNYAVYVEDTGSISGGVRRDVHGKPYFECDLVWPDNGVIIEYHGDDSHFTREGMARDARKSNILTREGRSLFTATFETYSSPLRFNEFAHGVREKVGKRFQCRLADFAKRGAGLRDALRIDYLQRLRIEDARRCYKNGK